ncbi:MAG TPA: CHAT domain-containing protein [Saprospiraceae bacterium]|nr:CHAT domain-containing protein [Saprospiraceae bacterium]
MKKIPRLIVMASCESGSRIYTEGKGSYLLVRYFYQGRSQYVFRTLWNPDDTEGSHFIKELYNNFKKQRSCQWKST